MKKSFWLLFILLLTSCREKGLPYRDVLEDFDIKVTLSDPVTVVGDLVNPMDLSISGSFILFHEDSDSTTAVLLDTISNRKIDFLWKGRGPGETTNTLDLSFYDNMTIQASVHPERIFLYNIKQLLAGEKAPCRVLALDYGDYASSTILQCDDDVLFYIGKDTENKINETRFCLRNMQDSTLYSFGEFPEEDAVTAEIPYDGYSRQTAWQGRPVLKLDHTKIVVPYYYAVGFDIVDIEKRQVECSEFYQYPGVECKYIPQIKATAVKKDVEKYKGFLDACSSDDFVYFLYSAKKLGDSGKSFGKYVLKYSWMGVPECCYILDREVAGIAVDENEKYLYVCSHEMEGGSIDRYLL